MSLADEEEDDTNALEATPASATEVIPDASQRTGLNAGDVVALVRVRPGHDGGVPMRVVAESREDEGGEERQSWSLVELGLLKEPGGGVQQARPSNSSTEKFAMVLPLVKMTLHENQFYRYLLTHILSFIPPAHFVYFFFC